MRGLGFLQLDPISTVAPAQQLVLWSSLEAHDRAELDVLLWERLRRRTRPWPGLTCPRA